jgi:hypothetical protein
MYYWAPKTDDVKIMHHQKVGLASPAYFWIFQMMYNREWSPRSIWKKACDAETRDLIGRKRIYAFWNLVYYFRTIFHFSMKQEPIMEIKFSQPFPLVRFENRSQKKETEACNSLIPSKPKACTSRCVNRFSLQGRAFSTIFFFFSCTWEHKGRIRWTPPIWQVFYSTLLGL